MLKLLDPELSHTMVAAHERDGMGPSAFGFAQEWLLLLGKRQFVSHQARDACSSFTSLSKHAVLAALRWFCGSLRQPLYGSCCKQGSAWAPLLFANIALLEYFEATSASGNFHSSEPEAYITFASQAHSAPWTAYQRLSQPLASLICAPVGQVEHLAGMLSIAGAVDRAAKP